MGGKPVGAGLNRGCFGSSSRIRPHVQVEQPGRVIPGRARIQVWARKPTDSRHDCRSNRLTGKHATQFHLSFSVG
jgi:hypothetical protein